MDAVSVGDTVKVKIISIDYDKQRLGSAMKLQKMGKGCSFEQFPLFFIIKFYLVKSNPK